MSQQIELLEARFEMALAELRSEVTSTVASAQLMADTQAIQTRALTALLMDVAELRLRIRKLMEKLGKSDEGEP